MITSMSANRGSESYHLYPDYGKDAVMRRTLQQAALQPELNALELTIISGYSTRQWPLEECGAVALRILALEAEYTVKIITLEG